MTQPILPSPTERHRLQEQIAAITPVWDQRDLEPPLWYLRFHAYLTMEGTRSVLKVANAEREKALEELFPTLPGNWSDAARQWQWVARARQYDRWRTLRDRLELEEERVQAGILRRQAIATAAGGFAGELERMVRRDKADRARDGRLRKSRPIDIVTGYKTLVDLERREFGESDTPVKVQLSGTIDSDPNPVGDDVITIDPNLLLPAELDELLPLLQRISDRVDAARAAAEADPAG